MTPRALDARRAPRMLRVNLAVLLLGVAGAIYATAAEYRTIEAVAAKYLVSWLFGGSTYVNTTHSTFYVGLGEPGAFALRVTPQCSSALLVVGLLAFAALTALLPGASFRRLATGVMAGGLVFFFANVVRLVTIVWSTRKWGLDDGFRISHVYLGTWVTTAGGVAAVGAYLSVLGLSPRRVLSTRSRP